MKTYQFFLFIFFFMANLHTNLAQNIVGTWYNADYNMNLQLNADNTYILQYSNGLPNETGYYVTQHNILSLQNALNGVVLSYTIVNITPTTLSFYDSVSNNYFNFTLSQQKTQTPSKATRLTGKTIQTNGSYHLTDAHVKAYTDLMAFILGHSLNHSQKQLIEKDCIKSFQQEPTALLQDAETVHQSMQQIYVLKDITQIGLARQLFMAEFYKNKHNLQSTAIWTILQTENPVLAYDSYNNLALSQKDLDGMLEFIDFINSQLSNSQSLKQKDKQYFKQQIISNFNQLSLEQKQSFCMGSLLNDLIRANWAKLSHSERNALKQQMTAKNQNTYWNNTTNQDVNNYFDIETYSNNFKVSPELEALKQKAAAGTLTDADFANYQAERQTQQMYFDVMNNMQLENHATMLNVINNIGGSDDYWEVKYNDY